MMNVHDYAKIGSAVLTGNPLYVKPLNDRANAESLHARTDAAGLKKLLEYATPSAANLNNTVDGTVVGFTTPALTFDKMRQINGSALSLNFDIEANIKRQAFKDSWNQWFKSWRQFFERYQTVGGKFSALLDSDAVAAQAESFRVQLMGDPNAQPKPNPGWVGAYEAEGTPDQPVPQSSAAPIPPQKNPDGTPNLNNKPPETGMPWWLISLFVVGGVGFVAGSYFLIRRKVIQGKEAEHFIKRDVLPIVLGSYMGPTGVALAHSATNRFSPATDPSGVSGPTLAGHEGVYFAG